MSGQDDKVAVGGDAGAEPTPEPEQDFMTQLYSEVTGSPLNMLLVTLIIVLVYKIFKPRDRTPVEEPTVSLPPLRKDMTVAQIKEYDGSRNDGRLLIAVNGVIFDVTTGRRFYGPGTVSAAHKFSFESQSSPFEVAIRVHYGRLCDGAIFMFTVDALLFSLSMAGPRRRRAYKCRWGIDLSSLLFGRVGFHLCVDA